MKDGEHIEYYKSGVIRSKKYYIDYKYHGEFIYYYRSGEVECKCYHINGDDVTKLVWISYNRNLKLELIGL